LLVDNKYCISLVFTLQISEQTLKIFAQHREARNLLAARTH